MRDHRSLRARLPTTTVVAVAASIGVVACGLSLTIGEATPEVVAADAAIAETSVVPGTDTGIVVDGGVAEAAADAAPDVNVEVDAGCTTVLKEDFAGDGGSLVQSLPDGGGVDGGKLTLVPRGLKSSAGAAYVNLAAPVTGFEVTFTFTAEALGASRATADGFAVSWLEIALPANTAFRDGPNFGMTNDPQNQHGYGFYADLFDVPRRIVETEIEDNDPTNDLDRLGTITTLGPVKLVGKIVRRGGKYVYDLSTPGENILASPTGAPTSRITQSTMDRDVAKAYATFVFSAGSGGQVSAGFHVDDVEIKSCNP